ncbi:Uncharacterised protein [uncultured archaeon]|nr:Uncharacterised protein [uncultured archaeon]
MLKLMFVLIGLSFILSATHSYITQITGIPLGFFESWWQPVLLSIGFSMLFALAWPVIVGVKKGDVLWAETGRNSSGFLGSLQGIPVVALESGHKNKIIRVNLSNGSEAKAQIVGYSGFFTPGKVRLIESEFEIPTQ